MAPLWCYFIIHYIFWIVSTDALLCEQLVELKLLLG